MQLVIKNTKTKLLIAVSALILSIFFAGTLAPAAHAQIPEETKNAACKGIGEATSDGDQAKCDSSAEESIRGLLRNIINLLSWIVGVIAVIMIIIGGFKYVTSNGDSNGIASAKHTIVYALIGVAIAVLAQVLIRFTLEATTKTAS